jgi:hypothetical protein
VVYHWYCAVGKCGDHEVRGIALAISSVTLAGPVKRVFDGVVDVPSC